ncbi:MAG: MerR family DNA-binding transcriptional regulator [Gemmata sp.]
MKAIGIGQLAKAAGVGVETVRFYERKGLLAPPAAQGVGLPPVRRGRGRAAQVHPPGTTGRVHAERDPGPARPAGRPGRPPG